MRRLLPFVIVLSVAASSVAAAQRPDWVQQVLDAARLPLAAALARQEGVPDSVVRVSLQALQNAKVNPADAKEVLDEARQEQRDHGPVGNFGAFVQSKLQAGLRGRDLAAAIHAERAQRADSAGAVHGNAKGAMAAGQHGAKNASATKGASASKGSPASKGSSASRGAPATKGSSASKSSSAAKGAKGNSKRPN